VNFISGQKNWLHFDSDSFKRCIVIYYFCVVYLFREMMIVLTGVQCVTIFNVPDNQV